MNMGTDGQKDPGAGNGHGHGGLGGMWMMVLCCIPMVLIFVLLAVGVIGGR
jgi:hypothetical protein